MSDLHIIPHQHAVGKQDRQQQSGHRSGVIWFTGLSGSGKSTLAGLLEQKLHAEGYRTYLLDGDNVRTGLNAGLTFSAEDRKENIRRIGEVAKLMVDAGVVVLTAFISPFRADRQMVRERLEEGEFVEVHVDCPLEVCEQRDVKGLYAKARRGEIKNFTGIDSPFEAPETSDLTVRSHKEAPAEAVQRLFVAIAPRLRPDAQP